MSGVAVVVTTYEDPRRLELVLDGLERQGPAFDEVVVADDGSARAPDPGPRPFPVRVVRQPDLGFRAAAARNLGAAATDAATLLFLDGDTVPGPGYVAALAGRCREAAATAPGRAAGRGLAVGRRRHVDLAGLGRAEVADVVATAGACAPQRLLGDPAWLAEGYARSADLRAADARSYRFVISAVLAVSRPLWDALGGFDESAVGYGGEDWELAHRAWLAGAELRHEPAAVGWHDGPDAGVRPPDPAARTRESIWLADRVPDPLARDPGLIWTVPAVAVELDDRGWEPEAVLLTCSALLRGSDARIWLRDAAVLRSGHWPGTDPRVAVGPPPDDVLSRAPVRVHVDRPVRPAGRASTLTQLCAAGGARYPGLSVVPARDRARDVPLPQGAPELVAPLGAERRLEAVWGRWA